MAQFRRNRFREGGDRKITGRAPLPGWLLAGLALTFLAATAAAAYLVFVTVREAVAGWGGETAPGEVAVNPSVTSGPTLPGPQATETAEPWDGKSRVSVLLMGIDHREGEVDPARTDTLILLTLDPASQTAAMLSIPRDMWVDIPRFGKDKINTAHYKGEIYKLPGGGPALAVETVENFLGVPIPYYVRVNFTAFEAVIDEIGGVDIENPEDIVDTAYPDTEYGFEPFYLRAGQHHLDGHDALRYARTRATAGGDFDRAQRQQQVILAVRDQVLNLDILPTLIRRSPAIFQTIAEGVRTNLSLDQMVSLALLAQDLPAENIRSVVIGSDYVELTVTGDGQSILKPIPGRIRELRDELFVGGGPYAPEVVPDSQDLLAGENARVAVQNGTFMGGLAQTTADYLRAKGLNVVEVGNAQRRDFATSVIIDYAGKPYTVRWLADALAVTQGNIFSGSDFAGEIDVLVIVGSDWQGPGE